MFDHAIPQASDFGSASTALGKLLERARAWVVPRVDRVAARYSTDAAWLEAALVQLDPTLSMKTVRARVVAVRPETPDVTSYWLRPNARFGAHRPGAHVTLRVPVDGQLLERSYSVSSGPSSDGLIAITVKRVPGGRVSNWLADRLRPGDVLELSPPQGQFLLPSPAPRKLVMISAGSGITPLMAMLRQLVSESASNEVTFMHFARSPEDVIFGAELAQVAERSPNVRVALCVERATPAWRGARGRFDLALLEREAPDFRNLDTFLCGPGAFMKQVIQTLEHAGADLNKLRFERFNAGFDASQGLSQTQVVRFLRSGCESLSNQPRTILEQAESQGIGLASGCRAGNCGTCRCTKRSGVVVDVTTGRASGEGPERIYACVSMARGTVEIEL